MIGLACIGGGHVPIMPTSQCCVYGANIRSAEMLYKVCKHTIFMCFFTGCLPYQGRTVSSGFCEDLMNPTPDLQTKILLAEDDNDMRKFLVRALQNAGYDVASFDNGLSAYNRLREEPFELLLTDIVMPEMDGIELARRATELDPDIKVMFITGFAAVALNPDNNAPKDAKILSKPFHLKDLVSEVSRLLAA